jgi:serine phosphatase RsbU (regulator of sigma subunit)
MTDNKKILTIEDDPTVRMNIVAYLEDSGYQMLEAEDGVAGLSMFKEHQPDLVLCDLRMPRLDGLEVLQEIAQTSPDTPVIIVSGAGMISDAIQALKRGAWDYVTKPIPDMQVLEAAIVKALERARLVLDNRQYQRRLEQVNRELNQALDQLKADQVAGRSVQSKLLPKDYQTMGDYVFRHRLYPAMYLSGDFVDYFPIDNRYIGFYMIDVSGHDTGSAFLTVMIKTIMQQMVNAYQSGDDDTILTPALTLEKINAELNRQVLNKYITMFYGLIDSIDSRLLASNGGQYPYPILYTGNQAEPIQCKSRPVGLFESVQFPSYQIHLPENFLLLLLSDGIFELNPATSNHECYNQLLSWEARIDRIFADVTAALGLTEETELMDDVTMLAVARQRVNG